MTNHRMMKPKEKAQEIFNKMYQVDDVMGNYPMCFDTAKKCALIAVDVILIDCGAKDWSGDEACEGKNYWQEVKSAMSDVKPYL
jgi:hypothetical protein